MAGEPPSKWPAAAPIPSPRSGVLKLSQIALAPGPPASTDTVIGVGGGTTDYQFTIAQLGTALGGAGGGQPFLGATKAGLPVVGDVPNGYYMLITDTVHHTTGLYYNNAGVLQVVFLSAAPLPPPATYYLYGF